MILYEFAKIREKQIYGLLENIAIHICKCLKYRIPLTDLDKHLQAINTSYNQIIKILKSNPGLKHKLTKYKPKFQNLMYKFSYTEKRTILSDEDLNYFCKYYYQQIIESLVNLIDNIDDILNEIKHVSAEVINAS